MRKLKSILIKIAVAILLIPWMLMLIPWMIGFMLYGIPYCYFKGLKYYAKTWFGLGYEMYEKPLELLADYDQL